MNPRAWTRSLIALLVGPLGLLIGCAQHQAGTPPDARSAEPPRTVIGAAEPGPRMVPSATNRPRPATVMYGPPCAAAIARARSAPGDTAIVPPIPREAVPPSVHAMRELPVRRLILIIPVSMYGRPESAEATISTVPALKSARDSARVRAVFAPTIEGGRYLPAVLDGCAVPGLARIEYQF